MSVPALCRRPWCGKPRSAAPRRWCGVARANWPARSKKIEHLKLFVSRKAFDIEGLGEKQLRAFYDDGLIREPADIFTLEARDKTSLKKLKDRERSGELSTKNLFAAIASRRRIALPRFILSLGIRHLGETTAQTIARGYGVCGGFPQGYGRGGFRRRRGQGRTRCDGSGGAAR